MVYTTTFHISITSVVAVYVLWVLLTYRLEGRPRTLLRPHATRARLVYTLVANIVVGIVFSGWLLHSLVKERTVSAYAAGFARPNHILVTSAIGFLLGVVFLMLQRPRINQPVVLLNIYLQTWTVSVAEIMVCWVLVGSYAEALFSTRTIPLAVLPAAVLSSILFGLYHYAHSPPFNTPEMIIRLTGIGLITSLFYFLSRDVYGTIIFHNFFATFGVMQSLRTSDGLTTYRRFKPVPAALAVLSLGLVISMHLLWFKPNPLQPHHGPVRFVRHHPGISQPPFESRLVQSISG